MERRIPDRRTLVSIVTFALNEQESLPELFRRLGVVMQSMPDYDFEVIAVDNGSSDTTWDIITAEAARDDRVVGVRLSRNFTAEGGLLAGICHARGDALVLMCADLQDPPEMIPAFVEQWEKGFDNVHGIVGRRLGTSKLRTMNSQLFYWLINRMTEGSFPRNVSDFRLVDRKVYESVRSMPERGRFARGMFHWVGFPTTGIEYDRPPRFGGSSKANTRLVLTLAIKGILSYSYLPLRLIIYMGLGVSFLSLLLLIWTLVRVFVLGNPFDGFGTIMGVMLLMFGFLFTMLGVVAEYVGLIYEEVKQRPNFIVSETVGR